MIHRTQLAKLLLLCLLAILFHPSKTVAQRTVVKPPTGEIAAKSWLNSLSEKQSTQARFSLSDDERENWNFVPMERKGCCLTDMSSEQKQLAIQMLQASLSKVGFEQTLAVRKVEGILGELENRPEHRNPEKYYVAIFGNPGDGHPWGWRFEGHHLSLNFSSIDNRLVSVPAFMGANPARVPSGPHEGLRIMAREEDLARALTRSLTGDQKTKAIIADQAPKEIVTGTDRIARLEKHEGIAASDLTAAQEEQLRSLIEVYFQKLTESSAAPHRESIKNGWDQVHFAWAGGLEVGDPHYYRIHGADVLIEYDNVQNDANHIHTVVRSLSGDFARDLLQEHHEHHHDHHGDEEHEHEHEK